MATYRQVQTSFWQDAFVLDLTPEEKFFYLYLLTNSKTTQCGIYELPKKIMETETGYNRETVEKLLNRFIDYGKIRYCEETKELMIPNWIKYNNIRSEAVKQCIKKELANVKHEPFVSLFYLMCERFGYEIETVGGGSIDSLDTVLGDSGEEKEEEKEIEKEKKEKKKKHKYAEFVSMTEEEYQKLVNEFGQENADKMVEVLNNYKGANGKTYKSDYLAIRNWVVDRVMKESRTNRTKQDQLPASVIRQLEREKNGLPQKRERKTIMDDPELARLYKELSG